MRKWRRIARPSGPLKDSRNRSRRNFPPGLAAVPLNPGIINTDMLRLCFASGAKNYPTAVEWAKLAAPFLLKLTAASNGEQLTVPSS